MDYLALDANQLQGSRLMYHPITISAYFGLLFFFAKYIGSRIPHSVRHRHSSERCHETPSQQKEPDLQWVHQVTIVAYQVNEVTFQLYTCIIKG